MSKQLSLRVKGKCNYWKDENTVIGFYVRKSGVYANKILTLQHTGVD